MKLLGKIGLALGTYHQASSAIARQFNPDNIRATRNAKLQKLIRYCFERIKYYRELFDKEGIKPEDISSSADLHRVPFLTKEQLRSRYWDFLPRELPPCRVSRTSGSTGIPVCILSDRNSRMFNSAAVIRCRQALGIGLAARPILTPLKNENEPDRKAHWTFLQGIHKTYYINPYVDSHENIQYAEQLLSRLKEPAVIGITPAIRALAYKVRDGVFPSFRPGVILTTGQWLEPQVKRLLESTFDAKVADIYACNEAGDVAWQCLRGAGYHINADNVIVEIVKENKPAEPGEVGEVVITNLNRYAMPIIRYKNGDLARMATELCPCGCKLAMLAEIIGRTGEDILLPDGKVVPWNQLKSLMNHPQIRQFQILQDADGSLKIRYIAEKDADAARLEHLLLYRHKNLLGPSITIVMQRTNKIPPAPSGKTRLVISQYKPAK